MKTQSILSITIACSLALLSLAATFQAIPVVAASDRVDSIVGNSPLPPLCRGRSRAWEPDQLPLRQAARSLAEKPVFSEKTGFWATIFSGNYQLSDRLLGSPFYTGGHTSYEPYRRRMDLRI